jgi:hypothetical protein
MAGGTASDQRGLPSRKVDAVSAWAARYEELALTGVRSREVTERIALHLGRFGEYLSATYGHDRLATVRGRLQLAAAGDSQAFDCGWHHRVAFSRA